MFSALHNVPFDAGIAAAQGDALSITAGAAQQVAWNQDTGSDRGNMLASGITVPGAPLATLCQSLEKAKPWAVVAVPLKAAVGP